MATASKLAYRFFRAKSFFRAFFELFDSIAFGVEIVSDFPNSCKTKQ